MVYEKKVTSSPRRPKSRLAVAETGRRLLSRMNRLSLNNNSRKSRSESVDSVTSSSSKDSSPVTLWEAEIQQVDDVSARKPGVIPKMWTPDEDQALRRAVKAHGEKNWRRIAEDIPLRNHLQCLQRWKKALRPGLVKGHWTKAEDAYLLKLMKESMEEHGSWNWGEISEKIEGRNAKQCRERWNLNLDPSINRNPWTDEEDALLMKLHVDLGGRWSLIAKGLNGRTENSVKTRYHSIQRKQIRLRGWLQEDDEVLIQALLTYGRNFPLFSRLLPGRSRGQMKKRYALLADKHAGLQKQIEAVEKKLEGGFKPTPIHTMVKQVQEKRKRNKQIKLKEEALQKQEEEFRQQQQLSQQNPYYAGVDQTNGFPVDSYKDYPNELEFPNVRKSTDNVYAYSQGGFMKSHPSHHQQIKREMSFQDARINRSNSAVLLHELLMEEAPVQNHVDTEQQFYEVDSSQYPEKSASQGQAKTYQNSQAFLDRLLDSIQTTEEYLEGGNSSNDEVDNSGYESPLSATDSFPDMDDFIDQGSYAKNPNQVTQNNNTIYQDQMPADLTFHDSYDENWIRHTQQQNIEVPLM